MNLLIQRARAEAGSHIANVIQMMYDGVAFRQHSSKGGGFDVFSHEGDELGHIAVADLSYAIMVVKKLGQAVGKCHHNVWDPITRTASTFSEPGFTFAWVGWHPMGC